MPALTDRLTVQPHTIIRKSQSKVGRQIITIMEFASGEVMMLVDDVRTLIQEKIMLKSYIDAYEVTYDIDKGWMAGGEEIPYLDSF